MILGATTLSSKVERNFPAVLKTMEDKVLEYGTACVSMEEQCIDFKSDFVPLCKMGTTLKIIRMEEETETQIFTGEVYLSSEKMLRLVSVEDELLPGSIYAYLYDVEMRGEGETQVPGKKRLFGRQSLVTQSFPIEIYAISLPQVKFTCQEPLTEGQNITLTITEPLHLRHIPLQVELPINFMDGKASSYRCKILELQEEGRQSLEELLWQLSLAANKCFPPVNLSSDGEGL